MNDITQVLLSSHISLYADDIKLCKSINTAEDAAALQSDLSAMMTWSEVNRLPFNVQKCLQMTFSRKKVNKVHQGYKMNEETLRVIDEVKDLGIILDERLYFDTHINEVIRRSKRAMGFVLRNAAAFRGTRTLLRLYNAFIRSQMEYGILIWNPVLKKYSDGLESIQRRFLKFTYMKIFQYYPSDFRYEELLAGFKISSWRFDAEVRNLGIYE